MFFKKIIIIKNIYNWAHRVFKTRGRWATWPFFFWKVVFDVFFKHMMERWCTKKNWMTLMMTQCLLSRVLRLNVGGGGSVDRIDAVMKRAMETEGVVGKEMGIQLLLIVVDDDITIPTSDGRNNQRMADTAPSQAHSSYHRWLSLVCVGGIHVKNHQRMADTTHILRLKDPDIYLLRFSCLRQPKLSVIHYFAFIKR